MAIVATKDTRNSAWASDTSAFGRKMLTKMGWKGGENGLGKNQQGTSTHLRAVRRAESLGIGAESDAFGEKGWQDTNAGFHGVLANLKKEYSTVGDSGSEEEDGPAKKKRRKEEKKRKKKEEKRRAKRNGGGSGNSSSSEGNKVRLPQNKVQAGHARKMREAKDIRNKSAEDMAAIFGVKADFYKQPREWVEKSEDGKIVSDSSNGAEEKKKKKDKKKSKELLNADDAKPKKDKKKRKRSSEGSDCDDQKKTKKDKSKK
mmetsp:Transcript_3830/g.8619  ORF Transcript_3830/g.8619 Transcript_3830/m.8619 type:complete len:259 (+) Transcript_3830:291-1067(+)